MKYVADGKVTIDSELNDKGLEQGLSNMQKKLEGAGSKLQSVGGKLTKGLTLPIVAAGTGAILMAKNFDDSMRKVKATMGDSLGATTAEAEKNFKALRDEAQRLGATTAFSASDAAGAMEVLALQGWETNQIMEGTGPILNAASAGGLELAHAAEIVAGNLAAFSLDADKAEWAADMLQVTSSGSATSMAELGEALVTAGGTAANAGMTLDQTNAILGTFSNTGLKGSRAGTTFNAMLRDLKDGAEDGKVSFGEFDVELYNADGTMRDMTSVLEDMENNMEGMTTAQKDAAIASVFGSAAQQGVNTILGQGVDTVRDLEEAMKNGAGASQKAADEMEGGIGGSFRSLNSAIEGLAIAFGDVLAPYVQKIADKLADLLGWFTNLSEEMKKKIVVIGAIVAAIGPLITFLGTMIIVISKVIGAFAMLSPPILIAIAAIGAIIAIGVQLYRHWDTVKEKAIQVFGHFQPLLDTVKGAFQNLVDSVGPILESLKTLWQSLIPILQKVVAIVGGVLAVAFGVLISTFNAVVAAIGPIINALINFVDFAVNMVNVIVALFTGDFAGAWEYLQDAAQSTIDLFVNLFTGLIDFVVTFVQTIIEFFHNLYMTLVGNSIIPDMVEAIVEWFQNMFEWLIEIVMNIVEFVTDAFMAIFEVISDYLEMAWEIVSSIWEFIQEVFVNALEFLKALVTGDFEGMRDAIQNIMESAKQLLENIWNAIDGFLTKTLGGIWDTIKSIFSSIFSTISSVLSNISSTISSVWNAIRSTITSVLNGIRSVISSVWNAIRSVITSVLNGIRSVVTSVWNGIRSVITGVVNGIRSVVSSVFNAIRSVISSIMNGIRSVITSVWNGIRSTISSVVNSIRSTISSIFNSLRGIVTGAMSGVRNAVSNGIKGALRAVTSMGSAFKNAGSKIVSMIADGIKGAASKVTGAAKNLMGKVRDFLPFSPAKEGPLTDIDKLNFGGPIEGSIDDAIPDVQAKMNAMLKVPNFQHPGDKKPKPKPVTKNDDSDRPVHIENVMVLDGEVLARASIDPIDTMLSDRISIESYLKGDR